VVVVGASAGGIDALKTLAAGLPSDLQAAVAVVVHILARAESHLPQILTRAGPLLAAHPVDGEPLRAGRIYVAPPDRHLVLRDGTCAVVRGPHEHHARPAIDPLFRSAAAHFGANVVAVVLSGARSDGVAGAHSVSVRGGTVIVQDPAEAVFPDMPLNTISSGSPDRVLPVAAIPPAVVEAVEKLTRVAAVREYDPEEMSVETGYALLDRSVIDRTPPGSPSAHSCPACGGVLWEIDDGDLLRFRCRAGHAYTAESVLDGEAESVEGALWAAFRALQERSALSERLARRVRERGSDVSAARFEQSATEALEQADLIRTLLLERDHPRG
jgi:two-component system chemotaxis response regulator CheB